HRGRRSGVRFSRGSRRGRADADQQTEYRAGTPVRAVRPEPRGLWLAGRDQRDADRRRGTGDGGRERHRLRMVVDATRAATPVEALKLTQLALPLSLQDRGVFDSFWAADNAELVA